MNICVVTPYDSNNFGAFLQAFALKRFLELDGHKVLHARTRSERHVRGLFYRNPPSLGELARPAELLGERAFAREKYLLFKRERSKFEEVAVRTAASADVVILGSDEIWNVRHRAFRDPVFYGHGLRRTMAYAPSIGSATLEDFAGHQGRLADMSQIDYVMVRDRQTADLVAEVTTRIPPIVLDPTFLSGWSDGLPGLETEYLRSNKYLLIYSYGSRHIPIDQVQRFARARGLRTVCAGFRANWCDFALNCGPLEFLDAVARAEYVFTTTFHGTIAAILRMRPFVSRPTSPKTTDLLNRLGLQARVWGSDLSAVMDDPIDYGKVFSVIEGERDASEFLLRDALAAISQSIQASPSQECS